MAEIFRTYEQARHRAQELANILGRETGIEARKGHYEPGYSVHTLPKFENRYGFELRLEIVEPTKKTS